MVPLADHHPGWSANRRGVQLCGSPDKPEDVRSHGRPAHTTPSETKPAVGVVDEWSSAAVSTGLSQSSGVHGPLGMSADFAPPNRRWPVILNALVEKLKRRANTNPREG